MAHLNTSTEPFDTFRAPQGKSVDENRFREKLDALRAFREMSANAMGGIVFGPGRTVETRTSSPKLNTIVKLPLPTTSDTISKRAGAISFVLAGNC